MLVCPACWCLPRQSGYWEVFCYLGDKGNGRGSPYFLNLYFIYNLPKVQWEEEVGFYVFKARASRIFDRIDWDKRDGPFSSFNQHSGHWPAASFIPVCQESEIRRRRKKIWVFLRRKKNYFWPWFLHHIFYFFAPFCTKTHSKNGRYLLSPLLAPLFFLNILKLLPSPFYQNCFLKVSSDSHTFHLPQNKSQHLYHGLQANI